jgi:hypothetical protein
MSNSNKPNPATPEELDEFRNTLFQGLPFVTDEEEFLNTSNVIFKPAQNAENTKICLDVDGRKQVEIKSVTRAKLEYDPELGFPVLHLEIANPRIKHN